MKTLLSLILIASAALSQTTNYPGALDTNATLFVTADNIQTTLNVALGTGDTSVIVASTSGFVSNMIATICNTVTSTGKCTAFEHMFVTNVAGNVLTVTRGFAGTSAITHPAGKLVSVLIDSAHQKVLKDAVIAIETALGPNLTNVPASPAIKVSPYDFAPQAPGGSLSSGACNITMSPVPPGVVVGDTLRLAGGTGSAEVVTISALVGSTVAATCANSHSGAWTVASATGGIQEAICALPSAGGTVATTAAITLFANVGTCSKTAVVVQRYPGSTISGSFTVLTAPPTSPYSQFETFISPPDYASLTQILDGARTVMGNFPITAQFGANTLPSVSATVGAIDFPTGGTGGGAGVAGYARTASVNANAVGLFGVGAITATTLGSGAWAINGITTNCPTTSNCTAGHSGINLYGAELDVNLIALAGGGTPVGNVVALSIAGGSTIQPTGTAAGIEIRQMGIFDGIGWKDGIYLDDGAATVSGISIGATGTGNNVDSMHLIFRARNSGGTNMQAAIFADALGDLDLLPATSSWVVLNDGALNPALIVKPSGSTPTVTISNSLIFGSNASHINTAAANKDIAGKCTFSGTTCTITFTTAYASAPACTAADQTAGAPIRANPSTTQLVLTGGSGAGATDVVSYVCIGNPN